MVWDDSRCKRDLWKREKERKLWFLKDEIVAVIRMLLLSERDHVKERCQTKHG